MATTRIIGLSGSLRKGSFNTGLLRAAAKLVPDGIELSICTINDIPLYDGDVEAAEGIPQVVSELKEAIADANGLLLATPEYNNSVSGVMKNAVDWLTRPPADIKRVFGNKPVAVIGATPGGLGTILSQNAWLPILPILRTLGTRPWFGGRLMVSRAHTVFDEEGNLTDDDTSESLRRFVDGFAEFVHDSAEGGTP